MKHDMAMGISAGVGTVAAGALFVPLIPGANGSVSVYDLHSFCSSGAGQFVQGLAPSAGTDCSMAGLGWFFLLAVVFACIVVFIVSYGKARREDKMPHTQRPCQCGAIQYWVHDVRNGYAWHCPTCGLDVTPHDDY